MIFRICASLNARTYSGNDANCKGISHCIPVIGVDAIGVPSGQVGRISMYS